MNMTETELKNYCISEFDTAWNLRLKEAEQVVADAGGGDVQLEATEHFEETADAVQVAGYYIRYHGDNALRIWKENTEGLSMSVQDKEADAILKVLYGDESTSDSGYEHLWDLLGDVQINEDECITEQWLGFPEGTFREDIWHWFDERHSKGTDWLMCERSSEK